MLDLTQPSVMGVLNVTPDSFSDGGDHLRVADALSAAERMVEDGVAILDVGGESTRPGAAEVPVADEIARVVPVIKALAHWPVMVSIDSRKPAVMRAALDAGATMINDVAALRAGGALAVAASAAGPVCLMHMQGEPGTMQREPAYDDVVGEVCAFLQSRADAAEAAGVARARIVLDPGFGFGKTLAHNVALFQGLERVVALGYPVLVGVSRKSMLGALTGRDAPKDRVAGGLSAAALAVAAGASIIRTHDVAQTVDAVAVARALSLR